MMGIWLYFTYLSSSLPRATSNPSTPGMFHTHVNVYNMCMYMYIIITIGIGLGLKVS